MNATKALSRVEIKDADKGQIAAVFATLNVIDLDGDVTTPGAFENGAKVSISAYGHTSWDGRLPVGKGVIRETKSEAILDGQFFMDSPDAAATFSVVKQLGEDGLQEFSYGYDPLEYSFGEFQGQEVRFLNRVKVFEVSPVLRGAGVNTRLLTAKSGLKFADHVDAVLADVDALVQRAAEVVALRAEKGKSISEVSAAQLARLADSVKRLTELVDVPATDNTADEAVQEYLRFVALARKVS